jgi:hypothetical protein
MAGRPAPSPWVELRALDRGGRGRRFGHRVLGQTAIASKPKMIYGKPSCDEAHIFP